MALAVGDVETDGPRLEHDPRVERLARQVSGAVDLDERRMMPGHRRCRVPMTGRAGREPVMAIDSASPRTRRALLASALGASVATVASAFGRPLSTRAADGDVIHVGDTLTATSTTELRSDVPFQEVLRAVSSIGVGLRGVTTSSTAVWGSAANGEGVAGQTDTGRAGLFVALERSGVALETHGRVRIPRRLRDREDPGRQDLVEDQPWRANPGGVLRAPDPSIRSRPTSLVGPDRRPRRHLHDPHQFDRDHRHQDQLAARRLVTRTPG